jgi:beta-N-acetylhexosaminidase
MSRNVGDHLIVGIPAPKLDAPTRKFLQKIRPGGVVLFARNIENGRQLRELTANLRAELGQPIIAVDEECNRVNRLAPILGEIPSIEKIKRTGDLDVAADFGRTIGRWLRQFGINLNFAPVLDLEIFGKNVDNALANRCWGRSADEVIAWAGAFLDGLEREGCAACAKHFPGLGAATLDSHEKLPKISRSRDEILQNDVKPYAEFARRLSAIMVSHAHFVAFDGEKTRVPASLSPNIITKLLRKKLKFMGLVLTDDLEMGAISTVSSIEDAAVGAILAGADAVLVCHTPKKAQKIHETFMKTAEKSAKFRARLDESAAKIKLFRDEWMPFQQ